jgi:hypothetical protein
MKYTDAEYKQVCMEAYELLASIQTAEQNKFQSDFDNSLSETMNHLMDVFDK